MTLILGTITLDYVVLVSDRFITRKNAVTGKTETLSDDAIKTVLFEQTIFGYTGWAHLPKSKKVKGGYPQGRYGVETNLWLAEVLALGGSLLDSLRIVAEEAGIAMSQVPSGAPPESYAMAFIGVGWWKVPEGLIPVGHVIANMGEASGGDPKVFTLQTFRMPEGRKFCTFTSRNLTADLTADQDRKIARMLKKERLPGAVMRVLRETVRKVSSGDTTVGPAVLQSTMPRRIAEIVVADGDWSITPNQPDLEHVSCRFIPEGKEDGPAFVPTIVLPDRSIFGSMSISSPGLITISMPRKPRAEGAPDSTPSSAATDAGPPA